MLALLIAGISTGAALAYLTAQESVENRLTAASTDIEITEQFDPPEELHPGTVIPKKVAVTSHSSTDCYVRVLVEFSSWKAQQFCEKLEILDVLLFLHEIYATFLCTMHNSVMTTEFC